MNLSMLNFGFSLILLTLIIVFGMKFVKTAFNQQKNVVENFNNHKYDLALDLRLQRKINNMKKNISK